MKTLDGLLIIGLVGLSAFWVLGNITDRHQNLLARRHLLGGLMGEWLS